MIFRFAARSLRFHLILMRGLAPSPFPIHRPPLLPTFPPSFTAFRAPVLSSWMCSSVGGDGDGKWNLTSEGDEGESIFGGEEEKEGGSRDIGLGTEPEPLQTVVPSGEPWTQELIDKKKAGVEVFEKKDDIFEGIEQEFNTKGGGGGADEWDLAEGYKPWTLGEEEEKGGAFDFGEGGAEGLEGMDGGGLDDDLEKERIEEQQKLERKEQELLSILKGPNRAFGDLIAASGITEDMLDSLILLKDVRGVKGLPPLTEIEDKVVARMNSTSSRAEIERKKQEEIAKARVKQIDSKGRSYGTGRRKCSVARVWLQVGDGKIIVNDKQFDAYFPILDHRADLLRPFTVTSTLGRWDVSCTVKGGGVSGQVGAVRLGISRALQNWEPGLRPYLKAAGLLTRDPRVVERKKPGKAKARKSFQWVKR